MRAFALLAVACSREPPPRAAGEDFPLDCLVTESEIPLSFNREIDLIFAVQRSSGLPEMLVERADDFMLALERLEGGFPDAHVGVIAADGAADGAGACPAFVRAWHELDGLHGNAPDVAGIVRGADGSATACSGGGDGTLDACDVAAALADRVPPGATELRPEPLAEMERALSRGCDGLRDGAFLAIVVITARDDCSASRAGFDPVAGATECFAAPDALWPASRYVDFLQALRPSGKLLLGVVAAPTEPEPPAVLEPTCEPPPSTPAPRMRAVTDALGEDGVFGSDIGVTVCGDGWSDVLDPLHDRTRSRIDLGCLRGPLTDAAGGEITGWTDAICVAELRSTLGEPEREVEQILAPCEFVEPPPCMYDAPAPVTNAPCWYLCDTSDLDWGCQDQPWQARFCWDDACEAASPPGKTTVTIRCLGCVPRDATPP